MNEIQKFPKRISNLAIALVTTVFLTVATPAYAAVLVQNFMQFDFVVDEPPITKVQGADADYDGDANDATGYLQVNLGGTIGNDDDTLGTPGSSEVLLSHEEITFTCFQGDRTYYTDVIQLDNTTASEDWDVDLTVEADLAGNPATAYTDGGADGDDNIDIWLFASEIDSTGGAVTETPNPGNYTTLTEWYDNDAGDGGVEAIQLEVVNSTMSIANASTNAFTIPQGEQRQLGLVVDCGGDVETNDSGTFRVTVEATPN